MLLRNVKFDCLDPPCRRLSDKDCKARKWLCSLKWFVICVIQYSLSSDAEPSLLLCLLALQRQVSSQSNMHTPSLQSLGENR